MALVPFPNKALKPGSDEDPEPDWDDHPPDSDDGGKMSFLEHLDELRRRIIWSVSAVFICFIGAWFFVEELVLFVFGPMKAILGEGQQLQGVTPAEPFMIRIKLAAMAGLLAATPVVATQIWLFIAPGLYSHEKKYAFPFVFFSSVCFIGGAAFSHLVVFPLTWAFFAGFRDDTISYQPQAALAFGIYLRLMLAFGLVFQMPVLVLALARMGVLTARFMIKNFKYAVLIIFVISAVVTPGGDWVTQIAMAGPLTVLYIFSIGLAWIFGKKKKKDVEETED
jgi:sec-independent protein translocase protein TatC